METAVTLGSRSISQGPNCSDCLALKEDGCKAFELVGIDIATENIGRAARVSDAIQGCRGGTGAAGSFILPPQDYAGTVAVDIATINIFNEFFKPGYPIDPGHFPYPNRLASTEQLAARNKLVQRGDISESSA